LEAERYLKRIREIGVPIMTNDYTNVRFAFFYDALIDYVPKCQPIFIRYKNHDRTDKTWYDNKFHNYPSVRAVIEALNNELI